MNRIGLIVWFWNLRLAVGSNVAWPFDVTRNALFSFYLWWHDGYQSLHDTYYDAWGWVPYPINVVSDWLRDQLWNLILSPSYQQAEEQARLLWRLPDALWEPERHNWAPACWAGDRVGDLEYIVVSIYDAIIDINGAVQVWVADQLTAVGRWVDNLMASIRTTLNGVIDYLSDTLAAWQTDIEIAIYDVRTALSDVQTFVNDVRKDPAGWVYAAIETTLLERIRRLVLAVW